MFAITNGEIWCTLPCNARKVSIEEAYQIVGLLSVLIPVAEEAAQQSVELDGAKANCPKCHADITRVVEHMLRFHTTPRS